MSETEHDNLVQSLFFANSRADRMKAQMNLRFARNVTLIHIFGGFIEYITALLAEKRAPRENHVTPFMMFHDGFEPILYLLWTGYDDAALMIETLIQLEDDADPRVGALATISLAVGNTRWQGPRVEQHLLQAPRNTPLQNAAANLARDYLPFSNYVQAKTAPDTSLMQRLEQYAAQVMSELVQPPI